MCARALLLWLTLASCTACQGNATMVVVLIDAQPAARSTSSMLRVRVVSADGAVRLDETRPIDGDTGWPLRLPLVPEGGDASRTWAVEATVSDGDGAVIALARTRGRYVAGATREVALCLYDGCADVLCGDTELDCVEGAGCSSCMGGACVGADAVLEALGSSPRCPLPGCTALGPRETVCGDGVDDDCDGRLDCLDPDCGCDAGSCVATGAEDVLAQCHDDLDNDCDGVVDCGEASCVLEEGPENCGNGVDDDCDGETDCFDAGCCAAPICNERACGGGGLRCCGGRCTNTWDDRENCGGCGITCADGRACDRPPTAAGTPMAAAACRCALSSGECPPRLCEENGGTRFCNCDSDGECPGASVCVRQAGSLHSACNLPR